MKKVLFVASEASPFIKTGGLADVAQALPKALKKEAIDVRVIIPLYGKIKHEHINNLDFIKDFTVHLNWREKHVGLFQMVHEGITYYFIDNEFYFNRNEIYTHYGDEDKGEKYAYFNYAVLEAIQYMDFKPNIIHCNDWHTGMIPLVYKKKYEMRKNYSGFKFLYTIHNLKYQGVFDEKILVDHLDIPPWSIDWTTVEYYGSINFMKAGIIYSDQVNTVSETYADEIKLTYYGEGLSGLLLSIDRKLSGIVNGIDYDENNPEKDPFIECHYSSENFKTEKVKNKLALQKQMGLKVDQSIPMLGVVSRLTDMKGFDIIRHIFEELMSYNIQLVLLGTGEREIEDSFRYFENKYPNKVRANIMFSNELAHKIYAASDLYIMPSKFEPCGLSQLIALRYGAIPIVRETGGLKDTIESYNIYDGTGNGFSFKNYNAHELLFAIQRALSLYEKKEKWHELTYRGMISNNSWEKSAKKYIDIYNKLLEN
jgi:starch synthase